ncbi:MAG: MFS transporter [Halobacteriaceae archaeon]
MSKDGADGTPRSGAVDGSAGSVASADSAGVASGRNTVFGSLALLVFLVNFGRVAFAPLVEPLMSTFGVREGVAGLVVTLTWLGSALPRLPTGYLLTRVTRHRIVAVTGGMLAAAAAFTAIAPQFVGETPVALPGYGTVPGGVVFVGAGAFLIGTASGVYFIAANPLVSELYPDRVGWALGVHGMAAQVAAVAAPALVGLLVVVADWWTVFLLLTLGGAVGTGLFAVATRRTAVPEAGTEDRHLGRAIRAEWRVVLLGVLVIGLAGFAWNATFNFYVSYLRDAKQIAPGTGRALLTLTFATGVVAFGVTGRLADRVPHVPLLLGVLGLFLASLFALTVVSSLAGVVAVSVVLGYAAHSLFPAVDTYLLSRLPDHHRGSAYAAYSASMAAISALGSVVLGTLVQAGVPYDTAFRAFVAGLGVVWAALLVGYRAGRLPAGAR